jgi:hypothetical protein
MAGSETLIRARNDLGQYVADDPSTPEDEAWVDPLTSDFTGGLQ